MEHLSTFLGGGKGEKRENLKESLEPEYDSMRVKGKRQVSGVPGKIISGKENKVPDVIVAVDVLLDGSEGVRGAVALRPLLPR